MKKIVPLLFLITITNHYGQHSVAKVHGCSIWLKNDHTIINGASKTTDSILNYNDSIVIPKSKRFIINHNTLKSKFTLFMVYKSNLENEHQIVNYKVGDETLQITNRKTISSSGISYSKYKPNQGVLVEYSANLSAVKHSNLCMLNFEDDVPSQEAKGQSTKILEFIFYPRILTSTEKLKIETYLSIKYGISLIGSMNYLSANGTKVWDYKENKKYTTSVTGISRDDASGLFQKQSGNCIKDGLYIGIGKRDSINSYSKNDLSDSSYMVWGNNGGTTLLQEGANSVEPIKKMGRIWKIQKTAMENTRLKTSFVTLNAKEFFQKTNYTPTALSNLWLAVSTSDSESFDYSAAKYYAGRMINENLIAFDGAFWDKDASGSDTFTFVTAPELFFTYALISKDCQTTENAKIKIKINGGQSPYQVMIVHNGVSTTLVKTVTEFDIDAVTSGDYTISVTDPLHHVFTQTIKVDSIDNLNVSLAPTWYLNDASEVEVLPNIDSSNSSSYSYLWTDSNGNTISKDKMLMATKTGSYSMTVKNDKGCQNILPFKINKTSDLSSKIKLFPNPVKSGESFHLQLNLDGVTDVTISVCSITGAILKTSTIQAVSEYTYTDSLITSGTYLLVIHTNSIATTYKLIVD